jgi:flagellar hook-associated protein 1 FlgK
VGTLFSALSIGTSGLRTAQIQLDVTANNIANVNTPGFSRQRAELVELFPIQTPAGEIGRGVGIAQITRLRDIFLDIAYVRQVAGLGSAEVQAQYYNLIEDAYQEPGENGFGTRLDRFFDALNDYANNVESLPVREAFLAEASAVATDLNQLVNRFDELRTNANEEVRNLVPEVNSLSQRIYELNGQIQQLEGSGRSANALRDQRGLLLDQLGRLVNISYQENANGQVQVQIGSAILVDTTRAREIIAFRNPALDPERGDLVELRFADDNSLVDVRDGEIFGALTIRDTVIPEQDARIDEIARALILELNAIHSQGRGLEGISGTLTSTNEVSAPTDPLTAAGLPFPITPGTFDVVVYDSLGNPTTTTITINAGTTLNDLATDLNAVANLNAVVNGNQLEINPDATFAFSFANDSTGALPALGLNSLFNGTDARSIALNSDLQNNPALLTSGFSTDLTETGDNSAALALANVRIAQVLDSNSSTIAEFYQSTVAALGINARANNDILLTDNEFINTLEARRQEVSGVNLDEEVTSLLLFQRAYEASARVITIADRMLETLLNIAR